MDSFSCIANFEKVRPELLWDLRIAVIYLDHDSPILKTSLFSVIKADMKT